MNMFRKIVTICLVAFLYVTADAQDFYDEFRAKSIDVEGMKIGHKIVNLTYFCIINSQV